MKYLDRGKEGEVYLDNGYAIKIYYDIRIKSRLNKKSVIKMMKIDTKRILLPREIYYRNGEFCGYKTKYIENLTISNLFRLENKKLVSEMKLIREDINNLSNNNILINDLNIKNTVFNEGIYIVDPGSFSFKKNTLEINRNRFNNFLLILINKRLKEKYHKSDDAIIFLYNRINLNNILDYIIEDFKYETLDKLLEDSISTKKRY